MSYVTTVIVVIDFDYEGKQLKHINEFTGNSLKMPLALSRNFDHEVEGYKVAECDIYMGAYNYFDDNQFVDHLNEFPWPESNNAVIIVQSHDGDFVKIWRPHEELIVKYGDNYG